MKKRKYTKIKTNSEKLFLRNALKELWLKTNKPIWKRLMQEIEKPTRNKRVVNVSKLEKYCNEDETVVVPGKVLGGGLLNKRLTVVAFEFSKSAIDKITKVGGKIEFLRDYIKSKPSAKMRIIG